MTSGNIGYGYVIERTDAEMQAINQERREQDREARRLWRRAQELAKIVEHLECKTHKALVAMIGTGSPRLSREGRLIVDCTYPFKAKKWKLENHPFATSSGTFITPSKVEELEREAYLARDNLVSFIRCRYERDPVPNSLADEVAGWMEKLDNLDEALKI